MTALLLLLIDLGSELMDGFRGYAPSSEGRQSVETWVVPVGDNPSADEFLDLPLGDDGVLEVESPVLPLDRAVQVQGIAQPVVRRPSSVQCN